MSLLKIDKTGALVCLRDQWGQNESVIQVWEVVVAWPTPSIVATRTEPQIPPNLDTVLLNMRDTRLYGR